MQTYKHTSYTHIYMGIISKYERTCESSPPFTTNSNSCFVSSD